MKQLTIMLYYQYNFSSKNSECLVTNVQQKLYVPLTLFKQEGPQQYASSHLTYYNKSKMAAS